MKSIPCKIGVVLLGSVLAAYAQSAAPAQMPIPTIGSITVNAVSHASVNIQYRANVTSWVQLKYGLSSGNYIYSSASYQIGPNAADNNNIDASVSLGGLAPGTTYYVLPTARPDEDDDIGICAVASCGAVEQVFTTEALPAVHPAPPAPPIAWVPTEPDTSSYTVIPLQVSSSTGECVAAQNVAAQPRWNGAVLAGDNITTILGKIFYGTVVEFPQGATCKVFQSEPYFHTGYVLPALPLDPNAAGDIDSPNHRWIVFRTQTVTPADFPPFGVRTGPLWAPKLAKLVAQNPGGPTDGSAPGRGVQNSNGQLFDCYMQQCHHFWFENMEWTHLADATVYPAGLVDPPAFVDYIRLIPSLSGSLAPATTPDYNVIDRIYAHGQPWPSRELIVFAPGGDHWAIINSWAQANMWSQGVYPQANPVINGAVLNIPQSFYQQNAFDNAPVGMTAAATATFTAPAGYSGVFYAWIDQTGLTIDYQTGTGVGMVCAGCTATSEASPSRGSVPSTSMYFFNGHFSNGAAILDDSTLDSVSSTALPYFRPLGIYDFPGQFAYVDNNFISAIGQTVYNDSFGAQTDETWTHNYFYFPRSKMQQSGQWDGYGYTFRNVFETKQALRWNLEGNIFDGAAAYQNPGTAVMVAGAYIAPYSTGTQDIGIVNNIFKHIASGFECVGGGSAGPPDSPTAARIAVSNNLWLDLNRGLYNNGGWGFFSGPFSSYPGCEDLNIQNNTVGLTLGTGPALFLMGGESVMGEGLSITNNEMHLSESYYSVMYTVCGQVVASHPANPATLCTDGPTGTTYTQMLNSSYMNQGLTITPSWNFTNNVLIGAETNNGGLPTWTDLSQAEVNQVAASFPPGNIFPTGATMAAREAAVNWDPVTYRIVPSVWNPGNIGADVDAITSATGTVNNIAVTPAATSVAFAYTAPDTRACYADVSPDGVNWTRGQDNGGAASRTLTISGLNSGATYQYRLMCYSDQSATYEYLANQITSGTATTLASAPASGSGGGVTGSSGGVTGSSGGTGGGVATGGGGGTAAGSGSPLSSSPTSLSFTAAPNALTGSAAITVTNGAASSTFSASATYNSGFGWLSVTPVTGSIGSQILSVSYNAAGLGLGTYNGNVIVSTAGGSVSVAVTLSVSAQITVSPQSLSFTYRLGDTSPPAQLLSIFSTPTGATYSTTASGGTWLSAPNVNNATAPGSIPVSIVTGAVGVGTSTGQITITPAGGNPVKVPVTITVQAAAPPALSISPLSQSYTLTQGSGATGGQVTVSNTGGGVLQFSARAAPDTGTWLRLTGSGSGSATSATPAVVGYTVDPSGLAPGIYSGQIAVTSGSGSKASVTVSLTLSQAPQSILLSESGITMSGTAGANVSSSQSFSVLNSGSGTMNWTASASTVSGGNWLTVSPAAGSSSGGQSGSTITVTANTEGLAAGQYYGSVNVAASGSSAANIANSPESVSVLLNVTAGDAGTNVSLSSGAVILAAPAGSATVESQQIALFNPGSTSLNFTATASPSGGGSWLTVTPASGSLAQGITPLTIQANPAGLGPGIQTGTVRVAFNDGTVDAITVVAIATGGTTAGSGLTQATARAAATACSGGTPSYLVAAFAEPLEQAALQTGVAQLVRVLMVDDCGHPVTAGGGAQVTFGNQDAPLSLTDSGGGVWEGTWIPTNAGSNVSVGVIATSGTLQSATASIAVSVADPSAGAAPQPSGVVNAASSAQAAPMVVAPGAFITVYGTGMASGNAVAGATVPLPSVLNGAQLLLGNQALPLSYSSTGQINGVVPQGLNPDTTYQLVAARGMTLSVPIPITITPYQPAIFSVNSTGSGQGAVLLAGTSVLAAPSVLAGLSAQASPSGNNAQPAQSGSYLSVFCTGLGPVAGPNGEAGPADGAAAPSTPLFQTKATITATLGGVSAPVAFAGLSPGSVALYQVNVQVPAGAPAGNAVPLVLTLTDPTTGTAYVSNTVTVAIQ